MASQDFEELTTDVSASPLWNPDLAPTTIASRTWSTWHIAALWIGMSVVITTYTLAGGFIEAGMTWWQAMITILLGNTTVLIPMILNAHAGTRYGISFPVLARASFGTRGANVPAILRAIVACGWFGIQTWIGGTALDALFGMLWEGWARFDMQFGGVAVHTWFGFAIFWLIQVVIILRGIEGIKYLESWSAPLLLAGGAVLLWWAASAAGGLGRVLSESSRLQKEHGDFWKIFPAALTASVGYWATLSLNIPDFTRYARSQRSQMLGQAMGLPLTMTAFAFIGVAVTSATLLIYGVAIPDPIELIKRFDSVLVVIFATIVIFAAQLTTNMAANVVSPSNDFSNLNPRLISYVAGGLITAVIGIVMMPWKLLASMGAYIFTWLIGYSGLMGAIGGIVICDYWLIRKQRLDLAGLFDPKGPYQYRNGVNWRAIVALIVAVAPVVPGFLRASTTPGGQVQSAGLLDTLYTYSWFITFLIGFSVYYLLMREQRASEPKEVDETAIRTFERLDTKSHSEAVDVLFAKALPSLPEVKTEDIRRICAQTLKYEIEHGERHVVGAAEDLRTLLTRNLERATMQLSAGQQIIGFQVGIQSELHFAALSIVVGDAPGSPGYMFGARFWRTKDQVFLLGWEGFQLSL